MKATLHSLPFARSLGSILLAAVSFLMLPARAAEPNTLTADEKSAGWSLLFDGKSLHGWRNFGKPTPPSQGWSVENGVLKCIAGGKGGDLISERAFEEFELSWEWSIPAKANNGLKYFILEERGQAIGHEYQMIDDQTAPHRKHATASFYDVLPPSSPTHPKPFGEWNHSRVVVRGQRVEHWLNGERVLTYELGSPELQQAVAASKFKSVAKFGTRVRGHIVLTYHNDEASYRNVKIRDLSTAR